MSKFIELLDDLKKRRGIEKDNPVAELLGLHRARIHAYRTGKETPDAYACTRLAIELGIDPMALIAQVEAETCKTEQKRRFWRDFFRRATRAAAIVGLSFTVFWSTAPDSYANGLIGGAKSLTNNAIMRSKAIYQRLLSWWHCATCGTKWQCY